MPTQSMPTQSPSETTAHYLYRLLYEENLDTGDLAGALEEADLQASDLVIAAADASKRRQEDLTIKINMDVARRHLTGSEDADLPDEEIREFLRGMISSEGFQNLFLNEAEYWFKRREENKP